MSVVRKIGWGMAILLTMVFALFASMIRFGPAPAASDAAQVTPPARADPTPLSVALTVPVHGVPRSALSDSWGQSRAGGARAHTGIDIIAPAGAPVIAAAPGTVEKLFYSIGGGGIAVYVRSPDRLWSYYYAHLAGYAPGLREGQLVRAGAAIGTVGDTGNAGRGNHHLHFGISRMQAGEGWWQGRAVNPYPLLAGKRPDR